MRRLCTLRSARSVSLPCSTRCRTSTFLLPSTTSISISSRRRRRTRRSPPCPTASGSPPRTCRARCDVSACGSVHETHSSSDASHMLERPAFHYTRNRDLGRRPPVATSAPRPAGRERMFYGYEALRACLPQAIEVLLDCLRNPVFLRSRVRSKVAEAQQELSSLEER